MPKMRFFQPIGQIDDHYDDILEQFNSKSKINEQFPQVREIQLRQWCVCEDEYDLIVEEQKVLKYIMACQLGFARNENINKPTLDTVYGCFKRTLDYLDKVFDCNETNVKKCRHKMVQKKFHACNYYLSKFGEKEWYDKLPSEILTFANKYGDPSKEAPIPIPEIK